MYIVLENTMDLESLRTKYLVLELDTLDINGEIVRSFCVIDSEKIPLSEIPTMSVKRALHEELMSNYRDQNWSFCQQAIESLVGSFRCELDSFYYHLAERIVHNRDQGVSEGWTGVVKTSELRES